MKKEEQTEEKHIAECRFCCNPRNSDNICSGCVDYSKECAKQVSHELANVLYFLDAEDVNCIDLKRIKIEIESMKVSFAKLVESTEDL